MIKKLGFLLDDLAPAQLAYQLITSGNNFLKETDKYDICLFYRNYNIQCARPNFGTFCAYSCFSYSGQLVTTDVASTSMAVRWPGPNRAGKIFFYVNELEWIKLRNQFPFEQLEQVYNNPKVELLAPSEEYYDILNRVWRKPYGIVENGNVKEFIKAIF